MMIHDLLQDSRYALRSLWRAKAFASVAILCLGFGIGLNATIFSVLDGVILRPYPYPESDRLLVVGEQTLKTDDRTGLSFLDLRDLKNANTGFAALAASSTRSFTVSDGAGDPDRYSGAAISWDLFPLLGAMPVVGQGFTADHDKAGAADVVLLGHDIWTARYQNDPNIVGRSISINSKPYRVIGVMPPGFQFPAQQHLWVPLAPVAASEPRTARGLFVLGRLASGVSPEQAKERLNAAFVRLSAEYPTTNQDRTSWIRSLREAFLPEDATRAVWIMMGSVTLVLFVACANVASLLVARATGRRREISVRAALGAGRIRIVRQLLTESVVLGLASVPLGIILAEVGTRLIAASLPRDQVPYYIQWQVDWRSLAYTVVVAVSTALVFGLFPALAASRGDLHESLKEGTRGNSASKSLVRSALVVVQVALALVSLVGAFLFIRTFHALDSARLGFDARPLMTMRVAMAGAPYDVTDAKLRRVEDVVRRVEALPGVTGAFASNYVPLSGGGGGGDVEIEGRPVARGDESYITVISATPHVVRTMGLTFVGGRDLTDAEGWTRAPVAVITQAMARRFWPSGNPIGSRFRLTDQPANADWFTVVGIVSDMNFYGGDPEGPEAAAFVPYAYQQALNTGLTIRMAGEPAAVTGGVRAALRSSDSTLPLFAVRTMEDLRRLTFWEYGLFGWIFSTIGVTGLLLASVGVYGVLSYSVSQRTKEIGVRVALGAGRADVLRLIVGQGVTLCGIGILAGLVLAPAATWFGRSLFHGISPFDPLSFSAVAAVLLGVAFVASYVPARRATRVDPLTALREE